MRSIVVRNDIENSRIIIMISVARSLVIESAVKKTRRKYELSLRIQNCSQGKENASNLKLAPENCIRTDFTMHSRIESASIL